MTASCPFCWDEMETDRRKEPALALSPPQSNNEPVPADADRSRVNSLGWPGLSLEAGMRVSIYGE